MNSVTVKVVIILARVESPILLWDKEEWGSLWGLGGYNLSGLQVFIDECFASLLFSSVKQVDLGNLGSKGVFEFNGVIERSMRRENVVSLLREDIGEVGAKFGDWDFLWFVSLGQLCRDCDFIVLFCRSSSLKAILTKRPVIFSRGYGREQLKKFMINIKAKVVSMIKNMALRGWR